MRLNSSFTSITLATLFLISTANLGFAQSVIDFEGLQAGTITHELSSGNGISGIPVAGSVLVYGESRDSDITSNAAITFDASCPGGCSGGDTDLFFPESGMLLIVAENLVDANNDGLVDDPDDALRAGQNFSFDFRNFGPGTVQIESINFYDIEGDENGGTIELYRGGPAGTLVDVFGIPITDDSASANLTLGVADIDYMRVTLKGSGALDNIRLSTDLEPFCGDNMVNHPGETCDGTDYNACLSLTCQPDCTCMPPIYNDPAKIVFASSKKPLDRLDVHGRIDAHPTLNPMEGEIKIILSNPQGEIYTAVIDPGQCNISATGKNCKVFDRGAVTRGGVARFIMKKGRKTYAFRVQTWGDISGATHPDMTVKIEAAGQQHASHGFWKRTKKGWKFKLPSRSGN